MALQKLFSNSCDTNTCVKIVLLTDGDIRIQTLHDTDH